MNGWQDHAACRGMDTDMFFVERFESTAPAKAVCAGCEVRVECLQYALVNAEHYGIWGGKSERERRPLRVGMHRPERRPARCGTDAGYQRHRRILHEDPCPQCAEAHHVAGSEYHARARLTVVAAS